LPKSGKPLAEKNGGKMKHKAISSIMRLILESGGIEIRDVEKGEEPFLYSTGNHGPGYVDIKGRVGFDDVFEPMISALADLLIAKNIDFELVVGMVTGGVIPGYCLKQIVSQRLGKPVVFIYQRGARKAGGHRELDTGDRGNLLIRPGCRTLIVEELVNFAGTTTNGALYERDVKGRNVVGAATILFYQNPVAIERLRANRIPIHYLIGLKDDLLPFALNEGFFSQHLVRQYLEFLNDPAGWHAKFNLPFYGA